MRSDIYSLGASLFRMAIGEVPFPGNSGSAVFTKVLMEPAPWPQAKNPQLSDGLSLVIDMMMRKERTDRYQTPDDALTDLTSVEAGGVPSIAGQDLATIEEVDAEDSAQVSIMKGITAAKDVLTTPIGQLFIPRTRAQTAGDADSET